MMIFPAKVVDSAGTDMWVLIYRTIITFLSAQSVTQTKDSGGHKTKDDTLASHQPNREYPHCTRRDDCSVVRDSGVCQPQKNEQYVLKSQMKDVNKSALTDPIPEHPTDLF